MGMNTQFHIHPILENLTAKQKRLVTLRVMNPLASNSSLIRAAGYKASCVTADGQRVIRNDKVQGAVAAILSEYSPDYDKNPREWIKRELLKEATGQVQSASPKRLKALELLGKMTGEFKERVTIDLTDEKRREMAMRILVD